MFIGEVLGFWLVVGVGFFGLRRLANGKESQPLRVVPGSKARRA